MVCGYFYQLPFALARHGDLELLGGQAGQSMKRGKIADVRSLLDELYRAIRVAATDGSRPESFFRLSEAAILFCIMRCDFQRAVAFRDLLENFLPGIQSRQGWEISKSEWMDYFMLLSEAVLRLTRKIPIESFEKSVGEIDWDGYNPAVSAKMYMVVGYVYLKESNPQSCGRAKSWIERNHMHTRPEFVFLSTMLLAECNQKMQGRETGQKITELGSRLKLLVADSGNGMIHSLAKSAVYHLRAMSKIHQFGSFDDDDVQRAHQADKLKSVAAEVELAGVDEEVSPVAAAMLFMEISDRFATMSESEMDLQRRAIYRTYSLELAGKAGRSAAAGGDDIVAAYLALGKFRNLRSTEFNEEMYAQLQDLSASFRKQGDLTGQVAVSQVIVRQLAGAGNVRRATQYLSDQIRQGSRRNDSSAAYIASSMLEVITPVLDLQSQIPGISAFVEGAEIIFENLATLLNQLERNLANTGITELKRFRKAYQNFSGIGSFHIRIYFRYQYFALKLQRLQAILQNDEETLAFTEHFLREIEAPSSPLFLLRGDWEDFRNLDKDVRNRIINKGISITKGDLPAAADHLGFSYRNLRSYITFNEVNRLGNFLDETSTRNKNLEKGIRLMLHDLYQMGTIFEVVFDIPQFLVQRGIKGFSARDMELSLEIKGTTAKKYIRIMCEIGLIEYEKSVGRKHLYFLNRERAMKRLGKEEQFRLHE